MGWATRSSWRAEQGWGRPDHVWWCINISKPLSISVPLIFPLSSCLPCWLDNLSFIVSPESERILPICCFPKNFFGYSRPDFADTFLEHISVLKKKQSTWILFGIWVYSRILEGADIITIFILPIYELSPPYIRYVYFHSPHSIFQFSCLVKFVGINMYFKFFWKIFSMVSLD